MKPSQSAATWTVLVLSLLHDAVWSFQSQPVGPATARTLPTTRGMAPMSYGWTGKPDRFISNIFEANKRWKYGKLAEDPDFFDKLGSGHAPKYLWIGCADARVPANEIMGEDAGTVFVLRNVANMVVNTDFNLMSGLQYAVSVLKVPHIIVCGHYDCGGVRASMQRKDHGPPLENWLRNIRDVYRLHRNELDSISDPEQRHRRLVELNVIEQCINLFKTGVVQRQRVETFRERSKRAEGGDASDSKALDYTTPRIHACVFDPKTGDLNRLQVDFREYIDELHTIYDLYTLEEPDVVAEKPHAPKPVHEFDYEERSRDPNDVFGASFGVGADKRDPNDVYQQGNAALIGSRTGNDRYGSNGRLGDIPRLSDGFRPGGSNQLPGFGSGAVQQAVGEAYSSYSTSTDASNGYHRNYGAVDGPRNYTGGFGSFSATDDAAYTNQNYDDPYRATDGAMVSQHNAFDHPYGPPTVRRDLNEIYRPPRATEGVNGDYGPGQFIDTEVTREYDDDFGTYRTPDGQQHYQGPPVGAPGRASRTFGPPERRFQRSSAPGGSYLDGLSSRSGSSNGYPDGSSGAFSY